MQSDLNFNSMEEGEDRPITTKEKEKEKEKDGGKIWSSGGVSYNEYGFIVPVYLDRYVSIESATLTIKPGGGRHEIYGKIMVSGSICKVYSVYNRKEEDAVAISDGETQNLTLCGPKYSVTDDSCFTKLLYVRLFARGSSDPFLTDDIYFVSCPSGDKSAEMISESDLAVLTVTFTRILYSLPASIRVSPVRKASSPDCYWIVSGTVNVVQMIGKLEFERTFDVFRSVGGEGVKVLAGEDIPLDRNVVVAPIQFLEVGPSLGVEIDLSFVEHRNGERISVVNRIHGRKTFVWRSDCSLRYSIRAFVHKKYARDEIKIEDAPDRVEIEVTTFYDLFADLSDEEDERDYCEDKYKCLGN